jgi:hypothetical protein
MTSPVHVTRHRRPIPGAPTLSDNAADHYPERAPAIFRAGACHRNLRALLSGRHRPCSVDLNQWSLKLALQMRRSQELEIDQLSRWRAARCADLTPYIEMTHLEDYDLKVVQIKAPRAGNCEQAAKRPRAAGGNLCRGRQPSWQRLCSRL